jgi:hypothetical protein
MKIFYQEEKTIPLGDFKFRKIAFGIEDNVDYQMETADQAIERIRAKVLDVLEAASKDAPKGKAAVNDKSKVKATKETIQTIEETTEQEVVKEVVKPKNSNNEKVLKMCKAISIFKPDYAGVIRAKLASLNMTIKDATEEQLVNFVTYLDEMMRQRKISYNTETDKITELLNPVIQPKEVIVDDGWDTV